MFRKGQGDQTRESNAKIRCKGELKGGCGSDGVGGAYAITLRTNKIDCVRIF